MYVCSSLEAYHVHSVKTTCRVPSEEMYLARPLPILVTPLFRIPDSLFFSFQAQVDLICASLGRW
jgi:hypothetical protein